MKILKGLINIFISFLIVLAILVLLANNILKNKIINKNKILDKIEETQVYLQVSRDVNNGFENYIYQSGLPEDTIKDLFTDEMIRNDINSIIDYIYNGTDIKLSDEIVKENLDKKISSYLDSQGLKINEQGRKKN